MNQSAEPRLGEGLSRLVEILRVFRRYADNLGSITIVANRP